MDCFAGDTPLEERFLRHRDKMRLADFENTRPPVWDIILAEC